MGDAVALGTEIEPVYRRCRECRRVNGEGAHTLGRTRKSTESIEAA